MSKIKRLVMASSPERVPFSLRCYSETLLVSVVRLKSVISEIKQGSGLGPEAASRCCLKKQQQGRSRQQQHIYPPTHSVQPQYRNIFESCYSRRGYFDTHLMAEQFHPQWDCSVPSQLKLASLPLQHFGISKIQT